MDKPRRIVAAAPCTSKSEALKLEAALKKLSRRAKQAWIEEHPHAP
jgi:predicted GIY-YIG superfamily endonuclease